MKKNIFLLLILTLGTVLSMSAQGIGFVKRSAIYESVPGFIKTLKMLDSLESKYTNEIRYEGALLEEQARAVMSAYNPTENENLDILKKRMKPEDTMKLRNIFNNDAKLKLRQEKYENQITTFQKEKIAPVILKVNNAIQKIAEEAQLDAMYIIEEVGSGLTYFNKKKDYTKQIIEALKKT